MKEGFVSGNGATRLMSGSCTLKSLRTLQSAYQICTKSEEKWDIFIGFDSRSQGS
jgi:hypothetical protein